MRQSDTGSGGRTVTGGAVLTAVSQSAAALRLQYRYPATTWPCVSRGSVCSPHHYCSKKSSSSRRFVHAVACAVGQAALAAVVAPQVLPPMPPPSLDVAADMLDLQV